MNKALVAKLQKKLASFTFVTWDRFIYDDDEFTFYGWIDRSKEERKDFLVLTYTERTREWSHVTSSAVRHQEINRLMGLEEIDTETCRRVEWQFKIKNMVQI